MKKSFRTGKYCRDKSFVASAVPPRLTPVTAPARSARLFIESISTHASLVTGEDPVGCYYHLSLSTSGFVRPHESIRFVSSCRDSTVRGSLDFGTPKLLLSITGLFYIQCYSKFYPPAPDLSNYFFLRAPVI